jgi:ligand-binding SRPBCC domain-containing protein
VIHTIDAEQWIPRPLEEVFAFFSDAFNLESITPPRLHFHVVTPRPIALKPGALINYKLRLNGIPLSWTTRIETWNPPHEFSDIQLSGPYKLWSHTHTFTAKNGGTTMTDHVDYELPLGPLGELVHKAWVRRDVSSIFAYREKMIRQRFS